MTQFCFLNTCDCFVGKGLQGEQKQKQEQQLGGRGEGDGVCVSLQV